MEITPGKFLLETHWFWLSLWKSSARAWNSVLFQISGAPARCLPLQFSPDHYGSYPQSLHFLRGSYLNALAIAIVQNLQLLFGHERQSPSWDDKQLCSRQVEKTILERPNKWQSVL